MDDFWSIPLWSFSKRYLRIAQVRLSRDLSVWSDIRAFPPLALLAGLNCVAGLIVMRQRAPGLPLTMSNWRLCVAAVATAGLTVGSRWLLARIERVPPAFRIRVFLAAVSVLPLIVLLTVATPRNSLGAIGFVSLLAVAAGNANLLWNRRKSGLPAASAIPNGRLAEAKPAVVRIVAETAPPSLPAHAADSEWTERSCDARGQILLRGKLIASFSAGQSQATLHVPFIPVFACVPEFSCQIVDQLAVRVRAHVAYPYGVRIELKRMGSAVQPLDVAVEFRATQASTARAA